MSTSSALISGVVRPQTVYTFGRDITRAFYPIENEQPINLYSQTPTIYIFSTKPSRAVAAAGTGAIETISVWNEAVESPYPRTYTISAIDDPDVNASSQDATYWEAINFKLKVLEQTQTFIRSFDVSRTTAQYDAPGTVPADVVAIFKNALDYWTYEEIEANIAMAIEVFKIDLIARGWRWSDVGELRFARYAIAYKALSTLCFGEVAEPDDRFDRRHAEYKTEYETLKNAIPLRADTDRDGTPDSPIQPASKHYISLR